MGSGSRLDAARKRSEARFALTPEREVTAEKAWPILGDKRPGQQQMNDRRS